MRVILLFGLLSVFNCWGASEPFTDGPLISGFGKHATVQQDLLLDKDMVFKVVFDVGSTGEPKTLNKRFDTLARFLNMHVANGIAPEHIQLALVIHGKASFDVLNNLAYQKKYGVDNPNHDLLQALLKHKVRILLCGQSAAYQQVQNVDVVKGVQMALSAMTAHAVLAREGYSLNPF
ncbi:MAG: intracellular sulfur oxidation DsrE/DsrF family protein [Paraglaciecola sp.]|jgi:intracellular sulfur oxidation DsrE/DsrF family protein